MNILQRIRADCLTLVLDVFHLATDQLFTAAGTGQVLDERGSQSRGSVISPGDELKGVGQQGITGQYGGGFVKLPVAGGAPPAQITVIHCRQIVMDEGVGMQAFNGHRSSQWVLLCRKELADQNDQRGPDPFAACLHGVAHGLMEPGRTRRSRRQHGIYARFHLAGKNSIYLTDKDGDNSSFDNFMPMQAIGTKLGHSVIMGEAGANCTVRW